MLKIKSKLPPPSTRRVQGYTDALNGKVSLSNDKFYLIGYQNAKSIVLSRANAK